MKENVDNLWITPEAIGYYVDKWLENVGTTLRKDLEKNANSGADLEDLLGPKGLDDVLVICRAIRMDRFAGKFLFTASGNYVQVSKNLEQIEAYGQGHKDRYVVTRPIRI